MADEDLLLGLAEQQKQDSALSEVSSAPAAAAEAVPSHPDDSLIDDLARQQAKQSDTTLRLALDGTQGTTPEKAAADYTMAKQSGLPMEVVERQSDLVKRNLEDQKILANLAQTPRTRDFLSEGDNFKLAKDDTAYLSVLEFIFAAVPPALGEGVEQVDSSKLYFKSIFGDLTAGEQEKLRGFQEIEQKRGGDIKNFGADGWFENAVVKLSRQLPILWNGIKAGGVGYAIGAGGGALTALAAGQLGPQAAVPEEAITVPAAARFGGKLLGGAGTAKAVFEIETGQAYGEFSQFKDENGQPIPQDIAKVGALVYGGIATGLEMFALEKVLDTIPGGKKLLGQVGKEGIKGAMRNASVRAALGTFIKDYGKAISAETLTEVMQEGAQIIIGELSKQAAPGEFQKSTPQENYARLKDTFVATAQAMSLMGAAGPGLSFASDSVKALKARNTEATIDTLAKHAQESKLAQRTPDKYAEFIQRVKEDSGLKDVYIDASQFDQYFQSQGINPEEMAAGLQIEDDLKQAAEAGNALRIPIEQYLTKIANTVHHEALKRSITFAPGDFTVDQAEEFEKTRAAELQKVIQDSQREIAELQNEEALPKQLQNIREKLVLEKDKGGAGFRAEDADAQVRLLLAGAKVLSKEAGESVQDWFDRVNPVLNISDAPVSQGGDVLNQQFTDQTQTPEFQNFFKGSKVVDESGSPLVVYHGTRASFNTFRTRRSKAENRLGAYFTEKKDVSLAITGQGFTSTVPVFLSLKNPFDVRQVSRENIAFAAGLSEDAIRSNAVQGLAGKYATLEWLDKNYDLVPKLRRKGFDGIVFDDAVEGTTYVAFKPEQIKSAIGNKGTFDPKNSNILLQSDPSIPVEAARLKDAGEIVSGLRVDEGTVANTDSIGASLDKWEIIEGIKEVPMSQFDTSAPTFYSKTERVRTEALAEQIKENKLISPLIVVYDKKGPYILEGGHRFDALKILKKKSFPAMVVIDRSAFPDTQNVSLQDGTNQFFQTVPEGDALVTLHNLTAENLKHADKIGGLAVPSLSIGKESDPLSGFGEISLVAAPSLVDPRVSKLNKVFNADIYSPRYPNVRYNVDTPALRAINKRFEKEAKDLGVYAFTADLDAHDFARKGAEAVQQSTVAQLAYLRSIGKDVDIPKRKAQTPNIDLNPKLAEFLDGYPSVQELAENPAFMKEYEKARQAEEAQFIKNSAEEGRTAEEAKADYDDLLGDTWYEENKAPKYRRVQSMVEEFNSRKEDGKPNIYEARTAVGQAINDPDVRPGFNAYAETIFNELLKNEKIVSDLTDRNGEYRLLPHTLDNVVREMKRHLNDGEGFNYGVGSIRSVVAKQFRSISELKADRNKIVTPEKMEALKEEVNDEFSALADKFESYLEGGKITGFGWLDRFSGHLKEMATRGTKAVMDDYYGGYVPAELLEEAKAFLNKLRNMGTEYFEAKVQRAVGLNEFSAALVPDYTPQAIFDLLNKHGITDVITYNPLLHKESEGRAIALKELKAKRPELFFQKNQSTPKGSIEFANSATVINLFKAADRSTFLHEAGHLFMREMGALVAAGKASEQLQADYKTLTDYVGGDISTVEAQEKLARAFEAYLREGEAPSVKLTDAFRRFRDWLTRIYKQVKQLNVELNDEVRGVFDRILASEAELAEAQRFYRSKDSLIDLVNPTPEQAADLAKKRKAAEGTALDKQVAKRLSAYFDAIGGVKELRKQAEAEVNAQPVYKMIAAINEAGGVDLQEVKKTYGKDVAAQIRKTHPGILKNEATKGIADFAAEFNFASPDAAIQAIQKALKPKDAIKNRTQDLIAQKESDIRKDLTRQEHMGGEEAIHNDASLTYLLAEANILLSKLERARNARPDQLEAKLYKDTAKEFLQKKKVREATRYDVYAKAEQRFAKAAFAAAEKGDITEAYNNKIKQALNHALVQEAIRLRDEKADIEKYFGLKNFKSKLKNVENSFMEAAVDLAASYGFIPSDAITVKTKDAGLGLANLDEVLAAQTPDFILRKEKPQGFKTYRDLPFSQFREVADTIKAVITFGNDTLKSAEAGEEQSRQAVIDASVARMQTLKDRVNSKLNELRDESSKASPVIGLVDGFVADSTMVQFLADWMDGFEFVKKGTFGPFRSLYNKVLNAEKDYNDTRAKVMADSERAWRTLGQAIVRIHKEHGDKLTIKDVPIPEDLKRTKRAYWSGQRMVALLLNTGNEGNYSAIQRGYSFTPQQIETVASYFTAEELKALQTIWDVTDSIYPQLDETHFAIYNRHIEKVPGRKISFTSKDGQQVTLDGGYYPLIFDHNINDQAAKFFEEDMMKNQTQAVVRSTKPEDGFSFSRVPGHSLPPLLDTSVWFRHINNVTRYVTHVRILRDINVITRDSEWSREVKKRAGHEHYKALRSWLQFQANPGRTENQGVLDWSRGVMTAVALGFKNSVGLKQRADVLKGIRAIGGKDLTKGWGYVAKAYTQVSWRASVLGTEHNKSWQDIIKRSSYVRIRENNIDREISDLRARLNPHQVKRVTIAGKEFTARDIQDAAYFWIKMNDRAAVSVVWTAAYNKFIAENADPAQTPAQQDKAAIAYADGIIQDTQASSLKPELSAIQRGEFKGLSRDMIKLFTAFMTESLKYGNRSMQVYRAWSNGSITTKELLHHIILEQVITPWTALMLGVAGKFGDLPEWWEFLLEPVYTYLSWIPLVRDVGGYFQHGLDKIGDTTLSGALKPIAQGLKGAGLFVIGEREFTAALWDVGGLLQAVYKVPALNFVKDVQKAIESIEGA